MNVPESGHRFAYCSILENEPSITKQVSLKETENKRRSIASTVLLGFAILLFLVFPEDKAIVPLVIVIALMLRPILYFWTHLK